MPYKKISEYRSEQDRFVGENSEEQKGRSKYTGLLLIILGVFFSINICYETYSDIRDAGKQTEAKFNDCLIEFVRLTCNVLNPNDKCSSLLACIKNDTIEPSAVLDFFLEEL